MDISNTKTHYRKVFKSDHLGVVDLEEFMEAGTKLIFTVDYVLQERGAKVAGKKIDANIAYFKEGIKPLVLNATNSKTMQLLTGSVYVENWAGTVIELYIDKGAQLMGQVVGGVRVSQKKVSKKKPVITKQTVSMWDNAKKAYIRDGNFNQVLKRADISKENQNIIIEEINNA